MANKLPDYLIRGEVARLFPVLATTSKEGRTTSIVLSCICLIHEFGRELLESIGKRVGTRATIQTFTEISFKGAIEDEQLRPDGLITLKIGSKTWSALVETKVGNNVLETNQLTNYRDLAKKHNIDAVITISNQFTSSPKNHPIQLSGSNRSKVDMFHWSWMHIHSRYRICIDFMLRFFRYQCQPPAQNNSTSNLQKIIDRGHVRNFWFHSLAKVFPNTSC